MSALPANLRLLCSYTRSISSVCRRIGINRQQFTKYLSGASQPSLSNLRKIADHFGLELHELLIGHEDFRRIVAIKRPIAPNVAGLSDQIRRTLFLQPGSIAPLSTFLGYYHCYHSPMEYPGQIVRGLCHVYEQNGFVIGRNIERYPRQPRSEVKKFNALFVHSGDKIVMFEREATVGRALWLSILEPFEADQAPLLSGLTLGVSRSAPRRAVCYRVVMEFLGRNVDLGKAMRMCGLFEVADPTIHDGIRRRINGEISPHEIAFLAR